MVSRGVRVVLGMVLGCGWDGGGSWCRYVMFVV